MLKIKYVVAIVGLALSNNCFSQSTIDSLDITFLKTTSLVFNFPIVNVDRGSKDVIAQKVKGADNTLQIKAARRAFPETNLTVITADGKLHHFYVNYADHPRTQTFSFDSTIQFLNGLNSKILSRVCERILRNDKTGVYAGKAKFKMKLSLEGIYVDDDLMFYHVGVRNRSNINYEIQSLRFFVRDKLKVKRTASQENEWVPLFVYNGTDKVKGKSKVDVICALDKFTIPDAKTLDIELFEKKGGRHLKLRIGNQTIVKAARLP